jgi:hypothetical protein
MPMANPVLGTSQPGSNNDEAFLFGPGWGKSAGAIMRFKEKEDERSRAVDHSGAKDN